MENQKCEECGKAIATFDDDTAYSYYELCATCLEQMQEAQHEAEKIAF